MARPMLTERSLSRLRAVDEAGLTHTVVLDTLVETRLAGGRITEAWTAGAPQPGRLNPLALSAELRAGQPSAARQWVLSLKGGATVEAGQRALVSGTTNGVAWQRLVLINEVVFPRSDQIRRITMATDVEINPGG